MPTSIESSHASRHRMPQSPPVRARAAAAAPVEANMDHLRRRYADRMQIRKTQFMPQPNWLLIGGVLFAVALVLGIGIGVGGGGVAIGVGLGWLAVVGVALIWPDLVRAYHFLQPPR